MTKEVVNLKNKTEAYLWFKNKSDRAFEEDKASRKKLKGTIRSAKRGHEFHWGAGENPKIF